MFVKIKKLVLSTVATLRKQWIKSQEEGNRLNSRDISPSDPSLGW